MDIATSDRYLSETFHIETLTLHALDIDHDERNALQHFSLGALESNKLNSDPEGFKDDNKETLLLCRGHIPAYLVSSGVHAVGVLVSGLRAPAWNTPSIGKGGHNIEHWTNLARGFLGEGEPLDVSYQRRAVHGSGLVFLLRGPRKVTKTTAQRKGNPQILYRTLLVIHLLTDRLALST